MAWDSAGNATLLKMDTNDTNRLQAQDTGKFADKDTERLEGFEI